MAEFVRYLEGRGYVERVPDPSGGRGRIVTLTPKGHQASAAARRAFAQIEAGWEEQIGNTPITQPRKTLADLASTDRRV